MDRSKFTNAKRIVIKLGTNVLRNDEGEASLPRLYSFIEDVSRLVNSGKEVIVITSGAVGLGRKKLGVEKSDDIVLKQACAAIGQSKLMSIYENGFDAYGVKIAQILLVEDDFAQRKRYLSLRNTLNKLLELSVIPIINQNDTVSTLELETLYKDTQVCFSDNDKLSALVASELDADLLIILSDVNGLYDSNPKDNPNANNFASVKDMVGFLQINKRIGIFPEGTTSRPENQEFGCFDPAFILMAIRTNASILPITTYWFRDEND
ncbi:MAG: glutamate 5-kinase, partial [Candidatus Gastranaerophilaceae bacterium]